MIQLNDFNQLKIALAQCAEVPQTLLAGIRYDGNQETLVHETLFPILGWDSDNDYKKFDGGQFMEYLEYKEPCLDFDVFFMIKNRQLNISTDDMFDDYEEVVGSEEDTDEMDIMELGELHRQYCFNYFNKKLAPHQLRLVELGLHENAYLLLIHDEPSKIQQLTDAFAKFGVQVILT